MKILFVNPFGIGDILFTTALFKPLKEKGHFIYYWCNERVVDILRNNRAVEDIFPLSRGDLKKRFKTSPFGAVKESIELLRKIKSERFDIALDFSLDYRYGLFLRLLGIKRIAGFDYKGRGRFLTDKIRINGFEARHMVEQYADLLDFVDGGLRIRDRVEFSVGDGERKWADGFLRASGLDERDILIGISPAGGASWGDSAFRKHWQKEKFASVAERLSENGLKIVLFGDEKEKDICDYISGRLKSAAVNACGKTDLGEFAALLSRCRLLITNDGGPLHMACALGVKTVSIFGPVDERVYGPYPSSKDHVVITGNAECRPCYRQFRYSLCQDRVCLDSIEPESVLKAARSILK